MSSDASSIDEAYSFIYSCGRRWKGRRGARFAWIWSEPINDGLRSVSRWDSSGKGIRDESEGRGDRRPKVKHKCILLLFCLFYYLLIASQLL